MSAIAKPVLIVSAAVAGVASVFSAASIASASDKKGPIKNVAWVRQYYTNPQQTLESFVGVTHYFQEQEKAGTTTETISEIWDYLCEWDAENKENKDTCLEDCDEFCQKVFTNKAAWGQVQANSTTYKDLDDCEKKCGENQTDLRGLKLALSGAAIGFVLLLISCVLAAIRIAKQESMGLQIGGIVATFLAWLFLCVGWTYLYHESVRRWRKDWKEGICDAVQPKLDEKDCYVAWGPAGILLITAWVLSFIPLVGHIVVRARNSESSDSNAAAKGGKGEP